VQLTPLARFPGWARSTRQNAPACWHHDHPQPSGARTTPPLLALQRSAARALPGNCLCPTSSTLQTPASGAADSCPFGCFLHQGFLVSYGIIALSVGPKVNVQAGRDEYYIMTSIQQASSLDCIIRQLRQELPRLSDHYDVEYLAVFGSYARNTQHKESDLDILVGFRVIPGLVKYISLEQHLSDLLGIPVDLVMESTLKPEIAARISLDRKII